MTQISDRKSFEEILNQITNLEKSPNDQLRKLEWFDHQNVLGLSRDIKGTLEIFLVGIKLTCESFIVSANIEYEQWKSEDGKSFEANRIKLSPELYFDSVAAFIVFNLINSQMQVNLQAGFSEVEPIIEMALDPVQLAREEFMGLIGELWTLRGLLSESGEACRAIIESWNGWDRSSRDFEFAKFGIEVKTTRRPSSIHSIQSLKQVEPGVDEFDLVETHLFLVSIGIEPALEDMNESEFFSLPELVDSILEIIRKNVEKNPEAAIEAFLERLGSYGLTNSRSYDHTKMRNRDYYARKFRITFVRAYNLLDPNLKIFHYDELSNFNHVNLDSISFQIVLPERVSDDLNPIQGLSNFVMFWRDTVKLGKIKH